MQNFTTALKAEHIKKKGTGIYVTAAILGLLSPLIVTLVNIAQSNPVRNKLPYNYFIDLIKDCNDPFATFFFPLMIIITVSRITQLDHKNGGWQLMETQPITKLSIFFSKFSVALIANLISIISLVLGAYVFGFLGSFALDLPENAELTFAFGETMQVIARLFIAGLFLTGLQYVISVLMPSFIWSILIGFFMLLGYLFLQAFDVAPDWYPIELLGKVSEYEDGSDLGYWLTYSAAVSVICSVLILYIGFEWYKHKKLKFAFGSGKRIAMLAFVVIVFGGLLYYTLLPNQMEPYNKTVIAGTIDSDTPVNKLYLTDRFIDDTVIEIPVVDNKFSQEIKGNLPLDYYVLKIGGVGSANILMAQNDSIFITLKKNKESNDFKVTGTRLAENRYKKDNSFRWSSTEYFISENINLDKVDYITKELVSDWRDAMAETDKFKTVDNYELRNDFKLQNKKLVTLYYLNLWNDFIKKREALFPTEQTPETADVAEMKKTLPLNDEGLLSDGEYFDYVSEQITRDDKEDINQNVKSLRAISKMEQGSFKDKMLYNQLKKSLEDASDKAERDSLANKYTGNFTNKRYTDLITYKKQVIDNLAKGKQAPAFTATDMQNQKVSLADLKGKYVLIDVWATWCGPCRYQSPYFEKLAVKYKGENIQFVALSTDARIDDWYVEAKQKSKSVMQLHIDDQDRFGKDYNAESIPRFILIDPEGILVNANMPFPNDAVFEKLIRETLGLEEQK